LTWRATCARLYTEAELHELQSEIAERSADLDTLLMEREDCRVQRDAFRRNQAGPVRAVASYAITPSMWRVCTGPLVQYEQAIWLG